MKELWIAAIEVVTAPNSSGNTRAFTNVVTWAEDADDFSVVTAAIFGRRDWSIASIHRCKRVDECPDLDADVAEQVERASAEPGSCIFGTLFYYPSKPA